jgi:DNA-binding MarR family transcriptional regulator
MILVILHAPCKISSPVLPYLPVSERDLEASVQAIANALHRTDHLVRSRAWHLRLTGISGVDLGRSGYSILTSLETDGAQRLTDLAEEFSLDQSTVSRRVAALERQGFVKRQADERDKRVSRVSLSPEGRKALRRHRRAIFAGVASLVEDWPFEERQALADGLSRFADELTAAVRDARDGLALSDRGPPTRRFGPADVTQTA